MTNLRLLYILLLISLVSCKSEEATNKVTKTSPNIIIIYVDDMGIGDVSYSGGETELTPNIDALAKNGKVFTQYYASAPVCSPSRVSVTTGMYPLRWNINTFLSSKKFNAECEQSDYLKSNAPTIAKSLKAAGYNTAHFGKWHMGGGRDVDEAPSIAEYGFDELCSTWESPNPDPLLTSSNWIWAATDSIKRWNRTEHFVNKTLDFLKRKSDRPCFVNLWPDDVHSPWVPNEESQENWKKTAFTLPKLKPVLQDFDKQIGKLIEGLKAQGVYENTLVIFTSDNGPAPSFERLRTNGLRGVKNSLYEGGILVPFIAHWPKGIKSGQVDTNTVIASVDLFPTLCNIAHVKTPQNFQLDGENFSEALTSEKSYERERDLYWDYGRTKKFNFPKGEDRSLQLAVRHKNWKLFTRPDGSVTELYNLEVDSNESKNVASENPDLTEKLKAQVIKWYKTYDKDAV